MEKKRDSGIELLRILAMLMVIGVHIFLYGKYFDRAIEYKGIVASSAHFLKLFFRPAVNIFVIITGYFMVHASFDLKKSYRRLLSIYLAIFFYSVVIGMFVLTLSPSYKNNMSDFVIVWKMLFPLTSQQWYFLTDYFLMCLFAPFLNIILQKMEKKEYQVFIALTTFIMVIWPTLYSLKPFCEIFSGYGHNVLASGKNVFSFLYIYALGGYVRLYEKERKRPKFIYLFFAIFCVFINYVVWMNIGADYDVVGVNYSNPLIVLSTVFSLLFFKDLHFYCKMVNVLASTTIGIYAIHESCFIRNFIWQRINFEKMDCSNLGINLFWIIFIMLLIFLVGAAIELIRKQIFLAVGKAFQRMRV
jgi:Uncharacterized protein conserved in bacteria